MIALALAAVAVLPWSSDLLRQPERWTARMNDALVRRDGDGLRIEVAPGRDWAIGALPAAQLPDHVAAVRIVVGQVTGGGRWLVRLWGDARGTGAPVTVALAGGVTRADTVELEVDPRLLALPHRPPMQVQVGLEGPPGSAARFDELTILAGPPPGPPVEVPGQRLIPTVERMPRLPQPFRLLDWRAVARGFDRLAFDLEARGELLPLIWLDNAQINQPGLAFGLPSYVGDDRHKPSAQEGVTGLGALVGASLVGLDKRAGEHDWVAMSRAWFNRANGLNLVLNHQRAATGGSFWYELWPAMAFAALADQYPDEPELLPILRTTCDRWLEAVAVLRGPDGVPDFDHTAFDFAAMRPVDNGRWREPDAAAAVAWLATAAWGRFGDARYRDAAVDCLRFVDGCAVNPYYENLLPWGAQAAARLNAEAGTAFDVGKLLEWTCGPSDTRGGWGVALGRWGGYDIAGLAGSIDNLGGYAFAMNTFGQAAAIAPIARYDPRYARSLGRWMLNLANAARLFYPRELPAGNQSCAWWRGDPEGVIAYEGLRQYWDGKRPYATGDPLLHQWGPKTDLGLYGSAYVGYLGGLLVATDEPTMPAWDCLATDFHHAPAWPTYLLYNPHEAPRTVALPVGDEPVDVYDAVAHVWLARGVRGTARVSIEPDRARVLVAPPAGAPRERRGARLLAGGRVIDHAAPTELSGGTSAVVP